MWSSVYKRLRWVRGWAKVGMYAIWSLMSVLWCLEVWWRRHELYAGCRRAVAGSMVEWPLGMLRWMSVSRSGMRERWAWPHKAIVLFMVWIRSTCRRRFYGQATKLMVPYMRLCG